MTEHEQAFYPQLIAEGEGAYEPRSQLTLRDDLDTALFLLEADGPDHLLIGRLTHLHGEGGLFVRLETFDDRDKLSEVDFAIEPGVVKLQSTRPLPFDGLFEDEATDAALLGRRISVKEPIRFAALDGERRIGNGDFAFIPDDETADGGRVHHISGVVVEYFRRLGKEKDGAELDGQEVVEVVVENPNGESERTVDLAENVSAEARAGGRFVITRKVAGTAGAVAVVSAGAVSLAVKLGRSRLRSR